MEVCFKKGAFSQIRNSDRHSSKDPSETKLGSPRITREDPNSEGQNTRYRLLTMLSTRPFMKLTAP